MTTRTTAPASAGGTSWVDRVVIPDDLSELDAEVRALRRERRVQRRRQRLRRLSRLGPDRGAAAAGRGAADRRGRRAAGDVPATPDAPSCHALGSAQATDRRLPDTVGPGWWTATPGGSATSARRCSRSRPTGAGATPPCWPRRQPPRTGTTSGSTWSTAPCRHCPPGVRRDRDPAGRADRRGRPAVRRGEGRASGSPAVRCWCSSAATAQVASVLPAAMPRTLDGEAVGRWSPRPRAAS